MSDETERYGLAISFLGTGDYRPATYEWNDKQCTTRYFPVAVCQFWPATELMVLATPQAQAKNGDELAAELQRSGCHIPYRFVSIPECRNESEMWELFDALSDQLRQYHKQRIVLDVTHGYRSLPVLALMAAAYLRVAADITVGKIVYGAYDARQDDRVPVFDLTPFLALLEWTSATEQFLKTGNAGSIAKLLKQAQDLPRTAQGNAEILPRELTKVATALKDFSQALHVLRLKHTLDSAVKLDDALRRVEPEVQRWAKPFGVLLEQVRGVTQQFLSTQTSDAVKQHLCMQRVMLDWYLKHERYIEAALLMREHVVSLVAADAGLDPFNRDIRLNVERAINASSIASRGNRKREALDRPEMLERELREIAISVDRRVVSIWHDLHQLRDDLAHVKDEARPPRVISRVEARAQEVRALPLPERGAGAAS